ncbi:MAG: hypothetical protein IIV87_00265 [Oscillospiraceae bacterium]|nr:hypothetical protein [Oscillospiraceae bacterium]MBQ5748563.1 hypothetical protein [Oscillospiraceae bacterium]
MKFVIDHDYHIHSSLSLCSHDEGQTPERILNYAKQYNLKRIVLTNHFWDESLPHTAPFYDVQNFARISSVLPLPQADGVEFLFGGEADMDQSGMIGLTEEVCEKLDFIIISTTHMNLFPPADPTTTGRANYWRMRMERVLESKLLPFGKVGLAHLTGTNIDNSSWEGHIAVIDQISDSEFEAYFKRAAQIGLGIELNIPVMYYEPKDLERIYRPYFIAKDCGCKFYLGGDAHRATGFDPEHKDFTIRKFERVIDALGLQETDKFHITR